MFGLAALVLLILACAIGPNFVPFDSLAIDLRHRLQPPFAGPHILGSDPLGRDQLMRLLLAGRISLPVGFVAMGISTVIGVLVGLAAGFYGGWTGTALMRLVDAVLCFPSIFLLLTLAALVSPSVATITLIIAAYCWMEVARIVEGQVRALREREFVIAAEVMGASDRHVMLRELLPNTMAPIIVAATLNVARAILLEAYVSFLGYGIQPPTAVLGQHAQQRAGISDQRALARHLSRPAITLAVTGLQFPRRRAARRARPARGPAAMSAVLSRRPTSSVSFRSESGPVARRRRRLLQRSRPAKPWRSSANPAPARA